MPHPRSLPALLAAVVLLGAGCSTTSPTSPPAEPTSQSDPATWSTSTDPVETGGLIWATGNVVHLSDDTTINIDEPIMTYVVAGDGVYFTPADSDDGSTDHRPMTTGPLHFANRDGTITDTGLTVYVESLGSSPDGRYLGLIDATSGPKDQFGTTVATAVIVDLATGERVVDTTDGMGDPEVDDLAVLYPEMYLRVRFPDSSSAHVGAFGDDHLYTLPGGEREIIDPVQTPIRDPLDRTSPGGAWNIDEYGEKVDVLRSIDGDRVRPLTGTSRWDLGWWFDERTVVTIAISGPGSGIRIGKDDTATLATCRVPRGECRTVDDTTSTLLRFPVGDSPSDSVDLRGGSS